ncbi:MAG: arginase [Bacilli bacterium]
MKTISIIGMPMDLGQLRRGVDMGPSAIRYAGIDERLGQLGYSVIDHGNIEISRELTNDAENKLKNLSKVVEANQILATKVDEIVARGEFPLVLGGDHSLALGSLAGIAKHYQNLGVIWYDAHADMNTEETTPSGNIHGMPLAASMGLGNEQLVQLHGYKEKVKPENIVLIGLRSVDEGERELLRTLGIKSYSMHEVDRLGMSTVMEETLAYLKHTDGIHLSLDLDALDPVYAPGVGTAVMGGLTYRESHLAMEMLAEANVVVSAEFVEVNPILDERNVTAEVAVALAGSLFGEKIK